AFVPPCLHNPHSAAGTPGIGFTAAAASRRRTPALQIAIAAYTSASIRLSRAINPESADRLFPRNSHSPAMVAAQFTTVGRSPAEITSGTAYGPPRKNVSISPSAYANDLAMRDSSALV